MKLAKICDIDNVDLPRPLTAVHPGLWLLDTGFAATVLDQLGVTSDRVREAAGRLFEPTSRPAGARVLGDGEAEAAIAQAHRFSAGRGQNRVDTQQMLLVIALDPGSAARHILNDLGVDPGRVKKELADMIPLPIRGRSRKRVRGRVCSFCDCTDLDRAMVSGLGVWICVHCVHVSLEILESGDRTQHGA
jgi:Clp amino terminal domain, pathogenicity island component/ClpX C4-type zinc finger